jgi:hypothetical protein
MASPQLCSAAPCGSVSSATPGRRSYRPEGYDEPEDLLAATEMREVVEPVQDGLHLLHQLREPCGKTPQGMQNANNRFRCERRTNGEH